MAKLLTESQKQHSKAEKDMKALQTKLTKETQKSTKLSNDLTTSKSDLTAVRKTKASTYLQKKNADLRQQVQDLQVTVEALERANTEHTSKKRKRKDTEEKEHAEIVAGLEAELRETTERNDAEMKAQVKSHREASREITALTKQNEEVRCAL